MQNPSSPVPQSSSSYVIDAENAAEMARLMRQARMLSEHFGLLPPQIDLRRGERILDIGCGPGEWALEVAQRFPESQITGIDISELMTTYARSLVESLQLTNVRFQVMDARQPLTFPDASFDFVNIRFIVGFMSTAIWPRILHECFRILRPGGIISLCEPESLGTTTSLSLAQYNLLLTQAQRQAGQCFAPFGEQMGISAVQPRLLREAGFQQVQQAAYVINYSAGTPAHLPMYENFRSFLKLLQPFLVGSGLITQEDVEVLYSRTVVEMEDDDFCAAAFFQRAWGKKPT